MAKGYSRTYRVDYEETLSAVVKMTFVCLLTSLANSTHWPLRNLNVKTVFLHSVFEDIYMEQLVCCSRGSGKVCKLKKLYGLK